jgi:carboxypeptidase Q
MSIHRISVIVATCAFVFVPRAARTVDRGPSTPEERAQALEYIRHFESDPLNPGLRKEIQRVVQWSIAVPDIHVSLCTLVDLPKGDKKHSQTLFTAMVLAQIRFAIEHRDQPSDVDGQYLAGVQGMLRAYEKVITAPAMVRLPALDDLLQRRDAGTLAQFVNERAATACQKKG